MRGTIVWMKGVPPVAQDTWPFMPDPSQLKVRTVNGAPCCRLRLNNRKRRWLRTHTERVLFGSRTEMEKALKEIKNEDRR